MVSLNSSRMSFSNSGVNEEEIDIIQSDDLRRQLRSRNTTSDDTEAARLISSSNSGSIPPSHPEFTFKPVDTICTGIFLITCAISLFIFSTVMPIECEVGPSCQLNMLSLLLYIHCLFWGITLICDQSVQYSHITLRRRGYLEFYSQTRTLSRLPFWIVSAWSTLLLSISTILHDYCDKNDGRCGKTFPLKKSEYISICIGLELVVLIPTITLYLSKIWKFNATKAVPDALRDDDMSISPEDGLNTFGNIDEELFQRQADLIHYFREQNTMLKKKVLQLNQQVSRTATRT